MLFRPASYLPLLLVAAFMHLSVIALAAAPASGLGLMSSSSSAPSPSDDRPTLALPSGGKPCPGSGRGAACDATPAPIPTPGQPSLPDGMAQCPADPAKPVLSSPAACDPVTVSSPASPAPASQAPARPSPVMPSVPVSSLGTAVAQGSNLSLSADRSLRRSGEAVLLTATASATVTGSASAIEIFDRTTSTLAGACMQASRCLVNYSASSGVHSFTAFITPPSTTAPGVETAIVSNDIQVSWLDLSLNAGPTAVGPGKALQISASTSIDVGRLGFVLLFWDVTTGKPLTYCGSGTSCSTMLGYPLAGSHDIVAFVADSASTTPASGVNAASDIKSPTWLAITLAASTTDMQGGGTVYLAATANADLTNTPWSMGIYDQTGKQLVTPCKSGRVCTTQVTLGGGPTPSFSAAIGAIPTPPKTSTTAGQLLKNVAQVALVNIQARSGSVKPSRLLWGVDSCKRITGDAAGASGLYPEVNSILGTPDFWGRYLTDTGNCPGISSTEVAAAASHHMGILPIYNDYDCSAVSGHDTGQGYATNAASAAVSLGIPKGTVLVIDIEPPGPWCSGGIDAAFVQGWYDGIIAAGYAPGYYGDGTASSTFASAWCSAVADSPKVAKDSYLWSFEPSLTEGYTKAWSPVWQPNQVGCAGTTAAWQYELSAGGTPDVDSDEALSKMPLWYP
ncbi:MAG: DUF1906 domain-containing protein [Chloroflexi bacterium]|nr:MAG: DUF1906 domain-containing protein [Chloroflexota bacterium]